MYPAYHLRRNEPTITGMPLTPPTPSAWTERLIEAHRRQVLGNEEGCAAGGMAHDEHVGLHGAEVVDRVEQRLPFGGRRGADVEVDDVGRQALRGNLEGGAGARRVLEEQVEHALAAQERQLLHLALGHFGKGRGSIQDGGQDLARQAIDGQQVLQLAVFRKLGITHRSASG